MYLVAAADDVCDTEEEVREKNKYDKGKMEESVIFLICHSFT